MAALLVACTGVQPEPVHECPTTGDGFAAGEQLVFGAVTPALAAETKSGGTFEDGKYHYVKDNYDFTVTMLEGGSAIGSATYSFPEASQDPYGALEFSDDSRKPLLWYYLETPYAFRADAGTAQVQADQKSRKNFLSQDKMSGYAGYPGVNHDEPCYMTAKQWYNKNKAIGLTETTALYKRVPLYVKHQRAKISVILKAGEGVDRANLAYDPDHGITTAKNLVDASIYSYKSSSEQLAVSPYLDSAPVRYAEGDEQMSACFEAIVDPFNYLEGANAKDLKITMVNLSGMKFSFCAANDSRYKVWEDTKDESTWADLLECYNLTAGKHLVIEVTLSTSTRKILITAYVTDWEEIVYSTVCDDNGTSGKPVVISSQQELFDFLTGPFNRSGKVAYIGPTDFALDDNWKPDGDPQDLEHYPPMILNATLNAASAQVSTVNRIFNEVHGQFVNAHITFGKTTGTEKVPAQDVVESVVTLVNTGSIERVTVAPLNEKARATRAGLVVTNQGTIINCSSALPVYYYYTTTPTENVYIGGIAAESKDRKEGDVVKALARIEGCKVTARVDGKTEVENNKVFGGGIVGYGESYVVNNSFEYGITLSQPSCFCNIISENSPLPDGASFRSGNSWPTRAENSRAGTNSYPGTKYDQVIDRAEELKTLVTSGATYNDYAKRFRISDSFTVSSADWKISSGNIGRMNDDRTVNTAGNVFFELDGNGKEIRLVKSDDDTSAPMLFTNITGSVHDLVVVCEDPLIYHKTEEEGNIVTSIAPLAYSVSKFNRGGHMGYSAGTVSNVKVLAQARGTAGAYVEAMAPSGLVVWAYENAQIEQCTSDIPVRVWVPSESGTQQTYFVGGIVNSACDVSLVQCKYMWNGAGVTPVGNVYYGGIVGGAYTRSGYDIDPSILITDCASKLAWTGGVRPSWGAIVGYAIYVKNNVPLNAMRDGCQGNWWDGDKDVYPVGRKLDSMSYDKVIGKRNSVEPIWDESNYTTE